MQLYHGYTYIDLICHFKVLAKVEAYPEYQLQLLPAAPIPPN